MDIISFNEAATANSRIEKINANPDSTSGIVTQPSVIQSGETVSIPTGRTAIMANTQINGTITLDGTMFIPSGATTTDIDTKLSTKVGKVASTDNAIVRFDGTTGAVQNSSITIDDNCNVGIGVTPNINTTRPTIFGGDFLMAASHLENYSMNNSSFQGSAYKYLISGRIATSFVQTNAGYIWQTAPSGTAGNPITWTNAMTLNASSSLQTYGSVICGFNGSSFQPSGSTAVTAYGGNANNYIQIVGRNTSDGSGAVLEYISNSARRAAILDNGTFQSATNVYGSTSDAKLKENVIDTSPKLEKLMQVQVRNFNYIGQEEKQIGVVAQEIEKLFPSIVFETKDTEQVEVTKERVVPAVEEVTDEEGNVITEAKPESIEEYIETETQETGEVTKNVKYSVLYMIAIKALQELNAKVEAMQLEINELKGVI